MNIKHLEFAVYIACMSFVSGQTDSLDDAIAVARRTPWGRAVPASAILAGIICPKHRAKLRRIEAIIGAG